MLITPLLRCQSDGDQIVVSAARHTTTAELQRGSRLLIGTLFAFEGRRKLFRCRAAEARKTAKRDQLPNRVSSVWITAFCLAMTWACQTSAMDMILIVNMQRARTSPI